jgi:hypothetical protein
MKWNSTQRDKLPKDAQEVLISVEGINYVAVYNKEKDIFTVTIPKKITYKASDSLIYWTEYSRPV